MESPEINPSTSGRLIYDKRGKNIEWRKDTSIIGVGKTKDKRLSSLCKFA